MNGNEAEDIRQKIAALRKQRSLVAAQNLRLAEMETERKVKHVKLAAEYRETPDLSGKPRSLSLCDDLARTDTRYVALLAALNQATYERDLASADAEARRFGLQLDIALVAAESGVEA